jgi:hypothetical protein
MADSPFVGPTYRLRSKPASVQRTINLIPVRLEAAERVVWVLKDVPGLVLATPRHTPTYYTSWPYPLFADEAMDASLAEPVAGQLWVPPFDELNANLAEPVSGTLDDTLQDYDARPEEMDADLAAPMSGLLDVILESYDGPPEEMNANLAEPVSGTLVVQLIVYSNWPADEMNANVAEPLSGTLA